MATLYSEDFQGYADGAEITVAGWSYANSGATVTIDDVGAGVQRAGLDGDFLNRDFQRTFTTGGTFSYSWFCDTLDELVRVYVEGVLLKSHTGPGSGADSVTVGDGQTVKISLDTYAAAARIDDLLLEGDGISAGLVRVAETDTARTLSLPDLPLGKASETDSARVLATITGHTLGRVAETDSPQTLEPVFGQVLGRITETDSARVFGVEFTKALRRITETDSARPLALSLPVSIALGRVRTTDAARTLTAVDGLVVYPGRVAATETARTMAANTPNTQTLGRVTGTNTARTLTVKTGSILPTFYRLLAR